MEQQDLRRWTDTLFKLVAAREVFHIDLETNGLDPLDPGAKIMCVGLANSKGVWCFPTDSWGQSHPAWAVLTEAAQSVGGLSCFNAGFDVAWLTRFAGTEVPLAYCTYAAFKALTTEGWTGQRWNLEVACRDVLGWQTEHKDVIGEALVKHGLTTKQGRPNKSEMWQLLYKEPETFLTYCGRDADASYQLGVVMWDILDSKFPELGKSLTEDWVTAVQLCIEQEHLGINLDSNALHQAHATRLQRIQDIDATLAKHPDVEALVTAEENRLAAELYAPHVTYKRTRAEESDCALLNSCAKSAGLEFKYGLTWPSKDCTWYFAESKAKSLHPTGKEVGGYWYKETPVYTPRNQDKPKPRVNWASDVWLRQCLYTLYPAERKVETTDRGETLVTYVVNGVAVPATPGGQAPTNLDVLHLFGSVGKILAERSVLEKECSLIVSYLNATREGRLHPKFKVPGTTTLRLSGDSGLNFQALPKVADILSAFRADPGRKLVHLDFESLEPKVAAYFTQDKCYLDLFASGVSHDVYLYILDRLFPELKVGEVYAPGGVVTKESKDKAKSQFKSLRELAKLVHLSCVAEGTPVLTKRGLVPIESVTPSDLVWDGVEWVETDGAVYKGERECILLEDISITPDHLVKGEDNVWREASYYSVQKGSNTTQPYRSNQPSFSWASLWKLVCSVFRR